MIAAVQVESGFTQPEATCVSLQLRQTGARAGGARTHSAAGTAAGCCQPALRALRVARKGIGAGSAA